MLCILLRCDIDVSARIGLSIVIPNQRLVMGPSSRIGHLTVARGMDRIIMGRHAWIGSLNWIYAIPSGDRCLSHEPERRVELIMDDHAAISHRHMIDCSNTIHLGPGSLVAGNRTQIITHGFSTSKSYRQYTKPIAIGSYSMVGTGCILLGGAALPDYSVLSAGSTLRNAFSEAYGVYSGVPAELVASIPDDSPYFLREHI